jgi:cell division septation protein DedD
MRQSTLALLLVFQVIFFTGAWSQKQPVQQQLTVPASYSIPDLEVKLYNMVNEYRASFNLPPIPLSRSLSFVAYTHVKDLYHNHPDQAPCNFHSWSNRGNWKPFCYPGDEKKNNSVWDKPRELTGYKGKGFEIIYWENNPVNIDSIIPFWSSIDYFNSFLLNTGKWQDKKWMAIGIGIYENYASAWFGEVPDMEEKPSAVPPAAETAAKVAVPAKPIPESKEPVTDVTPNPDLPSSPAPAAKLDSHSAKSGTYYIIVSSQQPMAKSGKLVEELKAKGYADAKVLAKDNKVRVSIAELPDKAKADSALREVKKLYKDAWILKW